MKKINDTLNAFFREKGLNGEWRTTEHDGCWGKGCSHPGKNELNVWRGDYRNISWSFEEGCSDKMIIETLTDRINKKPWE